MKLYISMTRNTHVIIRIIGILIFELHFYEENTVKI